MISDSDYLPTSDSDSESEYADTIEDCSILDNLDESDIADIFADVYEKIDDFFEQNILLISSPKFYDNLTKTVTELLCVDWDEDTEDEIEELVEQLLEAYFYTTPVPKRSGKIDTPIHYENKDILINKITALQTIEQPKQKSKEWYEFRSNLISASNLWKVFGTESQVNSLIYEKCRPYTTENPIYTNTESAMHWGNKYEPVTVMVYESMFGTTIGEFGCIQHPQHSFIGASPDGINVDTTNELYGRMLEIKNIVNREITGIPKEEYWIQTQIQMETCDLNECDFVETRFLEYDSENAFYQDHSRDYKGIILHFIHRNMTATENNAPIYKYMPLEIILNQESVTEWVVKMKNEYREQGLVLFTTIYWYLEEFSCVLIQRNREWFKQAVTKIRDLWQIVERERVEGYEHRNAKKRIPTIEITSTSTSYVIQNMHITPLLCLIKLD
jgi:putative phage-type endonuclease